jgi:molybdopterin molybdotransferase
LISLDEAQAFVMERCPRADPIVMPAAELLGRVIATDVESDEFVPPFANTAMDGFAVRSADLVEVPRELRVIGTLAAGGVAEQAVGPGEALRIMTGAPMPSGADGVIMVERTAVSDDGSTVEVLAPVEPGQHVRGAGEDIRPGDVVITAGSVLRPGQLGLLATLGMDSVSAYPVPRVGVLSTGDELRSGPGPLEPGQIRDSNRPALLALVESSGFDGVDLGCIPDDEAEIERALRHGVETCDALVSSGGVSMGDFDYVKAVLGRIGDMRWMQVAIKPAKPLAFGTIGSVPVFGLPGNPVSSMVSFELFARPALRQMAGHDELGRPMRMAVAAADLRRRADGKIQFMRVRADTASDGTITVTPTAGQGSHQLSAMAAANALAVLPDGDGVPAGASVETLLLDG